MSSFTIRFTICLLKCMEMGVVARDVERAIARDRRRGVDVAGEREQPEQRAIGRDRIEVLVLGADQDGTVAGDPGGRDDLVGGGELPADLAGLCDRIQRTDERADVERAGDASGGPTSFVPSASIAAPPRTSPPVTTFQLTWPAGVIAHSAWSSLPT